jgi:hypothetical protein
MADHAAVLRGGSVPRVTWAEVNRASKSRPASLESLRVPALVVLVASTLEASTATVFAHATGRWAADLQGTRRFSLEAVYRWIDYHASSVSNGGLTVVHSGGEVWCPIVAGAAVLLLGVSAALSHGWRAGRTPVAMCLGIGVVAGGLASIPLFVALVVWLLAIIGFVLWTALIVVVTIVLGLALLAVVVLLLWAWAQGSS